MIEFIEQQSDLETKLLDNPYEEKQNTIGGGKYQNGKKHGEWKEIIRWHENLKLSFSGNYEQGERRGDWQYEVQTKWNNDIRIPRNLFTQNDQQLKQEVTHYIIQNELHPQVLFEVKNLIQGHPIGRCYIFHQLDKYSDFIQIGNYNLQGQKTGFWRELILESFIIFASYDELHQYFIVEEGEYNENNRIGEWIQKKYFYKIGTSDIAMQCSTIGEPIQYINGEKNCITTELLSYKLNYYQKEILIKGEYRNGKKTGFWSIKQQEADETEIFQYQGQYNNDGVKIDEWIETNRIDFLEFNHFEHINLVYKGKYQNGQKNGEWKCLNFIENYQNGLMQGKQEILEIIGNIQQYLVKHTGECVNNQKQGIWKTEIYSQQGWIFWSEGNYQNNNKHGEWEEYNLIESFKNENYIIIAHMKGSYDNQQKIGEWKWCIDQKYKDNLLQISYSELQDEQNNSQVYEANDENNQYQVEQNQNEDENNTENQNQDNQGDANTDNFDVISNEEHTVNSEENENEQTEQEILDNQEKQIEWNELFDIEQNSFNCQNGEMIGKFPPKHSSQDRYLLFNGTIINNLYQLGGNLQYINL